MIDSNPMKRFAEWGGTTKDLTAFCEQWGKADTSNMAIFAHPPKM